jgi:Protein of unknown function (DUF3307)
VKSLTSAASINQIFTLLVIFQIKHFFADYPLQFPYMLRKYKADWQFLLPLSLHCFVHALLTLAICLVYAPHMMWLAAFDFCAHFIMDRIKSGPRYLGRFNDTQKSWYWMAFGFDQMVHHLTHLYIVYMLVTHLD